ncbi:MAG: substrate-binding domain-containing protein, partial [Candidatus Tectomicrobia bacterium]|nr:substrate-binding domain-containing protein [Candidatus Tectomicrobia bacterium]
GFGVERHEVMYNDFVLVGPRDDPAGVRHASDVVAALARIAARQAPFASRGDDSGTHKREMTLWRLAGVDALAASGGWYRETGSGMGTTLNIASGMGAYTLADRGTWLSFNNKGDLEVLAAGDRRLFNPYGVILVNPGRHPHVKAAEGQAFIDWLLSSAGQAAIAAYRIDGEAVFLPGVTGDRKRVISP